MSESPDIPALIESLQMMEDLNDLPLKPRHRRTLRGAIDALAALSVSQPTTASSEEHPAHRGHEFGGAVARAEALAAGDPDWMNATGGTPSVPLAVTAEQIAEAAQARFPGIDPSTRRLSEERWEKADNRYGFVRGVEWLLARSGGAPNFNSQPDLKETGTSGGAPTAQQVPSRERIADVLNEHRWRIQRDDNGNDTGGIECSCGTWSAPKGGEPPHYRPHAEFDLHYADAVLALLSAHPAETEWEYQCLSPFGDWRDVDSDHNCGADRRRSRNDGLWEPVPADEGGEKA